MLSARRIVAAMSFDGYRAGDDVDVSRWPVSALVAELRVGRVRVRDGARALRVEPWFRHCAECGDPFGSAGDLEAHVAAKCVGGPAPAWREITRPLTVTEVAAIEAGEGCPCCGAPASPEHMAEKHPEARKPHGTAYEAPSRAFKGGAGVREGGDRTRVLGASQAAA